MSEQAPGPENSACVTGRIFGAWQGLGFRVPYFGKLGVPYFGLLITRILPSPTI